MTSDLTKRILFVLVALVIYRFGTHIPLPFVDSVAIRDLFDQSSGGFLDVFNMFSGGALQRLSIFSLGVLPYISASIIMQLMSVIIPYFEQLKKEGQSGQRKITQYTRYGTVLLATFQSLGIAVAFEGQSSGGLPIITEPGLAFKTTTVVTLVTGTVFLMWLGEQITEKGLGNGISLIIFAGIVAGLPSAIGGTAQLVQNGDLSSFFVIILGLLVLSVTAFVVFMERGQRRLTVNYAQRQRGRKMVGGQTSHLPLKLNMAGVIPPIFASSIILFPTTLGNWLGSSSLPWIADIAASLSPGQPLYVTFYAIAIIFFCFFYTAVVFNPRDTADNLKRAGAFLPGIRPGEQTANYIDGVLSKLTLAGAAYIVFVCLIPEFLILYWNVPFYFGGTSLLIIVVVVMDFISQLQSHLLSNQYAGLMKQANLSK